MMNQEKLVTVTTFGDYIEAELAKQTLEDFGVKSVITGGSGAMAYGPVPALMDLQLQVFESQAQRAREILESAGKQEQ